MLTLTKKQDNLYRIDQDKRYIGYVRLDNHSNVKLLINVYLSLSTYKELMGKIEELVSN